MTTVTVHLDYGIRFAFPIDRPPVDIVTEITDAIHNKRLETYAVISPSGGVQSFVLSKVVAVEATP